MLPRPRWTGQALNGETVLLYAEQGFGDTLQFCRYVPMVAAAGGRVVLVVPKALRRLMATLGRRGRAVERGRQRHSAGVRLPLSAAEPAVRVRHDDGDDPRAGIVSAGRCGGLVGVSRRIAGVEGGAGVGRASRATAQPHAVAIDQRRSMRLADMAPLLSVPGCSFVSLQLGPPAVQMQALPEGAVLHDVSGRLGDWADTADLIMGLDLVIAVDTAVAHLAGALGRPVWMLNRFDSCWRWFLGRDDTPWYPSMRQFRQTSRGDWAGVIGRVREALAERSRQAELKKTGR